MNSTQFLPIPFAFSASLASLSVSHGLSTSRLPRLTPRHRRHLCLSYSSLINWGVLHEQDSQIPGVSEYLTPFEQQSCPCQFT